MTLIAPSRFRNPGINNFRVEGRTNRLTQTHIHMHRTSFSKRASAEKICECVLNSSTLLKQVEMHARETTTMCTFAF